METLAHVGPIKKVNVFSPCNEVPGGPFAPAWGKRDPLDPKMSKINILSQLFAEKLVLLFDFIHFNHLDTLINLIILLTLLCG